MLDLDPIRKRLEAATPGEWSAYTPKGCPDGWLSINAMWAAGPIDPAGLCPEDAQFIAHAPADIAALLGEVERLRIKLDALNPTIGLSKAIDGMLDRYEGICKELDARAGRAEARVAELGSRLRESMDKLATYVSLPKGHPISDIVQDNKRLQARAAELEAHVGAIDEWCERTGTEMDLADEDPSP
jgi:hypothetical protein